AWHLAILRFAMTRENAERLAVFAVANEIDGLGRQHANRTFEFFRKTSAKLSAAILSRDEAAEVLLRQYLAQVGDVQSRRTLGAALKIELPNQITEKRRSKATSSLWQGLPLRANIRT